MTSHLCLTLGGGKYTTSDIMFNGQVSVQMLQVEFNTKKGVGKQAQGRTEPIIPKI